MVGSGSAGRTAVGSRRRIVLAVVTILAAGVSCTESDPFESGADPLVVDRDVSTTVGVSADVADDEGTARDPGFEGSPDGGSDLPEPTLGEDPATDDPASDEMATDDPASESSGDDSGPASPPSPEPPPTNPGTTLPNGRSDQPGARPTGTNTRFDGASDADSCDDSGAGGDAIPDGPCVPGLPATE